MRNSVGSPRAGRRASIGRAAIFPEHRISGRGSSSQNFVDHVNTSSPASPSNRRSRHRRSDVSGVFFPPSEPIKEFVQAGDSSSLEQFLLGMSPSEREHAFAAETSAGGSPSPVTAAVKRGDPATVQCILKWLPQGKADTMLTTKDGHDGHTVLMMAASTGNPEVLELIASRLPREHVLKHLTERCIRGNLIFAHAVKTGSAAMIEAVFSLFPPSEVPRALCVKNYVGETPLLTAAAAPDSGAFQVVAQRLSAKELAAQLDLKTDQGQTALTIATRTGNASTWKAVARTMTARMVNRQLMAADSNGDTALLLSARSGSVAVFRSVVGYLAEDQVITLLGARNKQGQTPVQVAVACGGGPVLTAMLRPEWISACCLDARDASEAQLTALDLAAQPPANLDAIKILLACGATPTSGVVLKVLRNCAGSGGGVEDIAGGGMATVRECFLGAMAASEWARNPLIPGLNLYVALVSAYRQTPYFKHNLKQLKSQVDALVLCVLRHLPDTVEGFDRFSSPGSGGERGDAAGAAAGPEATPNIATAKLSLTLTIARGVSITAGERWGADTGGAGGALQATETGTALVQEMLEPELAGLQPRHCSGPLAKAMQCRHVDFICTPLVVDYLRLKFSAGLPNPFTKTKWRRDHGRVDRSLTRFMLDQDESNLLVYVLQGGCADSPSWTYLPGLQFILAGVCGRTGAFFGVPALRLALDVLVYVGVVAVFVLKVLVLRDSSTIGPWDILWMVYLVGAIWKQVTDVQEAGSIRVHLFNPWNIVEVTSLASLSAGFFFRMWAYMCHGRGMFFCGELSTQPTLSTSELNEVYVAQYFLAASAPFVLGKVLFLTQIHSSLGPLLHLTFNMMGALMRFGAIMMVIIFGFALGFYAMFGSESESHQDGSDIAQYDTYLSTLLTLFASMLGSFDFKVFGDAPLAAGGVVLLFFFLCVMNITLLNLLIAILASAHARVEVNSDKEAVLSEAVIITQYRRAMRLDSLPSPLNVPQELLSHLFWRRKERVREVFARAAFWLVSGPIAIFVTALLWALSVPRTLAWSGRVLRSSGSVMVVPALLGISFNLGLAPLATGWLWLGGVAEIWQQGHGTMEASDRNEIEASRAHRRGSNAGSPINSVASAAALAAKLGSAGESKHGRGHSKAVSPSTRVSNLWKRAAEKQAGGGGGGPGGGGKSGSRTRYLGFDVVLAIRELHGVSVQQLKQRLVERSARIEEDPDQMPTFSTEAARVQETSGRDFAEALAELKQGQQRLQDVIRKVEENGEKMETKLDRVFEILTSDRRKCRGNTSGNSMDSGHGPAFTTAMPRAELQEDPLSSFSAGPGGAIETSAVLNPKDERDSGRGVGSKDNISNGGGNVGVNGGGGSEEVGDQGRRRGSSLDEFIIQYHKETNGR